MYLLQWCCLSCCLLFSVAHDFLGFSLLFSQEESSCWTCQVQLGQGSHSWWVSLFAEWVYASTHEKEQDYTETVCEVSIIDLFLSISLSSSLSLSLSLPSSLSPTITLLNCCILSFSLRYMKRRCHFLDTLPAYNYNTGSSEHVINSKGQKVTNNTRHLGSTLMDAFLREVEEFCDPDSQADWSKKPHQQVRMKTGSG